MTRNDKRYITRGLLEALLEYAEDAEPSTVSVSLAVTPASTLDASEIPNDAAVFTDFYLPDAGSSVNAVFGVDLGTPTAQTQGRFISHPDGDRSVSLTDDLHATMFVAVPPWTPRDVTVYDRRGARPELVVVDVEPPAVHLDE